MDQKAPVWNSTFRMKQLPKAEYKLMQAMIDRYHLDGPHELYTILLRLCYEVIHMDQHTVIADGDTWFTQLIATYRSYPTEHRTYELPSP